MYNQNYNNNANNDIDPADFYDDEFQHDTGLNEPQPILYESAQPTFYCLGSIFLKEHPLLQRVFILALMGNFLSLLISYTLAGTQTLSGMLGGLFQRT